MLCPIVLRQERSFHQRDHDDRVRNLSRTRTASRSETRGRWMNKQPNRITIYNHKGGVGKTTLTANIAFALSELGKSVLLVDSDPQCNLTSYLLSDDVVDDLLNHSNDPEGRTIWTAVKPILDNTGIGRFVEPISVGDLTLLPGDIRLSEFEEFLGDAWAESFKRRLGGLRATSSISDVVSRLDDRHEFDFVFYDTGPNIGPLNRVLLLDSDFFIVPVACDLFSVRALGTLGQTFKRWINDSRTIHSIAPDGITLLNSEPKFLGYIPQRFKVYGQQMTKESKSSLGKIKSRVYGDISSVLRDIDKGLAPRKSINPVVGQVKDFASAVQVAQREGVAIWQSSFQNGRIKEEAKNVFNTIALYIIKKTEE